MEALNDQLELPKTATIENFAHRVRDLVIATNQEKQHTTKIDQ